MQNESNPKVSVVLPTYNSAKTLGNSIMSIINQTFKDWELIVIDDGSMDSTPNIVRKFQEQDQRVTYQWQPHEGIVSARNHGNKLARGEVIVLQDADDFSLPDRLEKCYKEIKKGADIVLHDIYINMWDAQFQCMSRGYVKNPPFNKYRLLQSQCYVGACAFRKQCWQKKPFRVETEYAFDWMMHLDWAFSGFKYKVINEGLYEYVRMQNSASQVYEKDGRRQQSMDVIKETMQKEYGVQTKD
jgi:glycosyltransferase involved in cell wall biosynthesis